MGCKVDDSDRFEPATTVEMEEEEEELLLSAIDVLWGAIPTLFVGY